MSNNIPLRIAVTGVTGRMGQTIIRRIIEKKHEKFGREIVLGAAISRPQSNICGMDIGMFLQSTKIGVVITDNIALVKEDFDILIDFTTPTSTIEYLKFCKLNHKNMVIGTTGLNQDHFFVIKDASKKIGIIYSANFSVGITIMLKLLKEMSQIMEKNVDINIIEEHHNKKKDIPSGTSLIIRNFIEKIKVSSNGILDRNLCSNADFFAIPLLLPTKYNIPIHSIRAGDTIGTHTVLFSSLGESLKIEHKASHRLVFADGALRSAVWLGHVQCGLFNLSDVLGFNM